MTTTSIKHATRTRIEMIIASVESFLELNSGVVVGLKDGVVVGLKDGVVVGLKVGLLSSTETLKLVTLLNADMLYKELAFINSFANLPFSTEPCSCCDKF
jgi:hypothetical protein